jgi:ribosomal-protein-alanine N-acetyltransferase
MSESTAPFRILPATRSDIDAICAIADASFPIPWPRDELEKELTRAYATLRVLRPSGGGVAAFLDYWHIQEEVQIMNVAVLPALRHRGYAGALLEDALRLSSVAGATFAVLEVRPSNLAAIRLYERYGFARMGVRPRYYSDNQEDALVMGRGL